jgi:hypothetical protein
MYIYIYKQCICIHFIGHHTMSFCPQDSWQSLLLQPLPQLRRAAPCPRFAAAAAGETTGNGAEILGDTWHNLGHLGSMEPPKMDKNGR